MIRAVLLKALVLLMFVGPAEAQDKSSTDVFKSPVHFKNYQELFSYIAGDIGLENNPEILLNLAADSRIDYVTDTEVETAVITANYIVKSTFENKHYRINQPRGASGNGPFYVFHSKDGGLDLVGVLWGNGYSRTRYKDKEAFETTWHMSAAQYTLTTYAWNGEVYQQVSSESVIEAEDRSR